jgi:hypothetical protein
MMEQKPKNLNQTQFDGLMSAETLALLIPRVRLSLASIKDKRRLKQSEELLDALEDLAKALDFRDLCSNSAVSNETPYWQGLPRCLFQIEEQFSRYTNPVSPWRTSWAKLRGQFWSALEKGIPWSVKESLVSWRWTAELVACRRIESELSQSREVVGKMHKDLQREEKKCAEKEGAVSFADRLKIVLWSRRATQDEACLLKLEQQRDTLLSRTADILEQCEKMSAAIALGLRTLYVDCGEFYGPIFEDNCRAVDREIKAQKEAEIEEIEKKSLELQKSYQKSVRDAEIQNARAADKNSRLMQVVTGELEERVGIAEKLIGHEFYCLNALEIEKQDNARKRWKRAVSQMKLAVDTVEESFNNEEPEPGRVDATGTGGAYAAQVGS